METSNFKTISTMRKIFLLFTILMTQFTFGQSLDNATINKIKAKFYGAEASFDKKDYRNALEKIEEIEVLGNGIILPTAQNLKVKVLIGLKDFSKAKKELEKLQNLNLSEDIIKDIASYSDNIDNGIMRIEKDRIERMEREKKNEIIRINGEIIAGIFNGYATYNYYESGNKYVGNWKNGIREGQGTFYFKDGRKYIGNWKVGKYNGQGTYYLANGNIEYKGNYKDDKRNGEGILYYTNGNKYEGSFKDGEPNNGIIYDSNGNKVREVVSGKTK